MSVSIKHRNIAIALLTAGLAIAIGALSYSWFTAKAGGESGGVGLGGVEACREGFCHSVSWGDIPRIPTDVTLFGYLGKFGGLAAAAAAIAAGVMLLTQRARKIPVKHLTIAFGVAAFGQAAFVTRFMTDGMKGVSIGWALFVSFAGLITAAVLMKSKVPQLVAEANAAQPPVAPAPQPYTIA
jgi:hypothetical protein